MRLSTADPIIYAPARFSSATARSPSRRAIVFACPSGIGCQRRGRCMSSPTAFNREESAVTAACVRRAAAACAQCPRPARRYVPWVQGRAPLIT